jgi:hypothetical protein
MGWKAMAKRLTSDDIKLSDKAMKELEALRDELGLSGMADDIICYSPACPHWMKEDDLNYGISCFHEDEQAWVCCQEDGNKGCGKIILTVADYNKRKGKPADTHLYRAANYIDDEDKK